MPFDGVEPKTDPRSLPSLVNWLQTKPPEEGYEYLDVMGHCLLGQYARAMNRARPLWKQLLWFPSRIQWATLNFNSRYQEFHDVAVNYPHTFGDALARGRRMLGSPMGGRYAI